MPSGFLKRFAYAYIHTATQAAFI